MRQSWLVSTNCYTSCSDICTKLNYICTKQENKKTLFVNCIRDKIYDFYSALLVLAKPLRKCMDYTSAYEGALM